MAQWLVQTNLWLHHFILIRHCPNLFTAQTHAILHMGKIFLLAHRTCVGGMFSIIDDPGSYGFPLGQQSKPMAAAVFSLLCHHRHHRRVRRGIRNRTVRKTQTIRVSPKTLSGLYPYRTVLARTRFSSVSHFKNLLLLTLSRQRGESPAVGRINCVNKRKSNKAKLKKAKLKNEDI
jgi:hypothetical protein